MSRKFKNGREDKIRLPPFVPILLDEIKSQAFGELLPTSLKVYCHFKRIAGLLKAKSKGTFNGLFDFTYSEAKQYGFSTKTFSNCIADLNNKGFIDIVDSGGLRGNCHSNAKYKLSERWRDYGSKNFLLRPRYPSEPVS